MYCFVDWRVCIARSPSTLPWGFLHSQEKGIIASGNFLNLGDIIEGISNFICDDSALSRTSDNASCAQFYPPTFLMYYDPVRIEGPSLVRQTVYLFLIRTLLSVLDVGSGTSAVMTSWIYGSPVSEIKPIWVCAFDTSHIGYRI